MNKFSQRSSYVFLKTFFYSFTFLLSQFLQFNISFRHSLLIPSLFILIFSNLIVLSFCILKITIGIHNPLFLNVRKYLLFLNYKWKKKNYNLESKINANHLFKIFHGISMGCPHVLA